MNYPYTYISCPCTDVSTPINPKKEPQNEEGDEQERTFDPRSPRANLALYPLEHLLYCEDCQQIRCPRCTIEEIVCWYCPSCLFEMPTTMVKSEGGRCTRNCFNCPICTAPLATNSMNPDPNSRTLNGPWILSCGYCNWSSLDIGWQFEKLTNIHSQMAKLSIGVESKPPSTPRSPGTEPISEPISGDSPDATFASLRSFYASQISASNPSDPLMTPSGGYNYSSPSSLARIMSLYTGRGAFGKKDASKASLMRESADASEGLRIVDPTREAEAIEKLRTKGWTGTTSLAQQKEQRHPARFVDDLRPTQALLRTKRSKRCRTCRHILAKPEAKVQSTRFKIRLVALNYIPTISLKPLQPAPSTRLAATDLNALPALQASQFLLTLKNPLFEAVKITLATPALTPGRYGHKVTVLCPQFDIGSNVDQWDEALGDSKNRRSSKLLGANRTEYAGGDGGKVAEAGKVWEKGRNWTTVVVEIVCAAIEGEREEMTMVVEEEDADVLEVPVFVRMEWEGDVAGDEAGAKGEGREKRELAYWVVIGVGRVARFGPPASAQQS